MQSSPTESFATAPPHPLFPFPLPAPLLVDRSPCRMPPLMRSRLAAPEQMPSYSRAGPPHCVYSRVHEQRWHWWD